MCSRPRFCSRSSPFAATADGVRLADPGPRVAGRAATPPAPGSPLSSVMSLAASPWAAGFGARTGLGVGDEPRRITLRARLGRSALSPVTGPGAVPFGSAADDDGGRRRRAHQPLVTQLIEGDHEACEAPRPDGLEAALDPGQSTLVHTRPPGQRPLRHAGLVSPSRNPGTQHVERRGVIEVPHRPMQPSGAYRSRIVDRVMRGASSRTGVDVCTGRRNARDRVMRGASSRTGVDVSARSRTGRVVSAARR